MLEGPMRTQSFVLRIWRDRGRPGWQGWIQHVRSGESASVSSVGELLAFVQRFAGELEDTASRGLR